MPEAQLYRAPHSFSYQWLKNGQPGPRARPNRTSASKASPAATTPARSPPPTPAARRCRRARPSSSAARSVRRRRRPGWSLSGAAGRSSKLTCPEGVDPAPAGSTSNRPGPLVASARVFGTQGAEAPEPRRSSTAKSRSRSPPGRPTGQSKSGSVAEPKSQLRTPRATGSRLRWTAARRDWRCC